MFSFQVPERSLHPRHPLCVQQLPMGAPGHLRDAAPSAGVAHGEFLRPRRKTATDHLRGDERLSTGRPVDARREQYDMDEPADRRDTAAAEELAFDEHRR